MSPTYSITTPIYYINDAPHLGHAYTTVTCDVLARYQRMRGKDVLFLTGTDEHGQKVERTAKAAGLEPQVHADRMVVRYHEAWKALEISHGDFIRTTEPRHVTGVQELWRRMSEAGDLYKASYEGPYCVGCESFYPESQVVDGKCPTEARHPIEVISEESYFFRLSKYQQPLLDFYRSRPDFVVPRSRLNEVVSFVEMGLQDLSVSRTKVSWGVPVPGASDHVMYVWIDALANYITALGFGPGKGKDFSPFWPADLQVIGKDILRFHAVYWPAFLMSAGVELPRQILSHGWWNKDGAKMSKTRGNVADAMKLVQWFGPDAVRYFLMREISLGADGNYSEEAMVDRINSDLANDLGNTLARVTKILSKDMGGKVPSPRRGGPLAMTAESAWKGWVDGMEALDVQAALRSAWTLLDATNKYLVAEEPWQLLKDPAHRGRLEEVMHESTEAVRHVASMMAPVMPQAARDIWRRLGLSQDPFTGLLVDEAGAVAWGFPDHGTVLHESSLFPRIDKASFFADVPKPEPAPALAPAPVAVAGPPLPPPIAIEDFMKIGLRAARVLSCKKHPDADKLLVLELDDGSGTPRTVCAGVAAWYSPDQLVGKTVAIVANLLPRKMRGVTSQGMVLAASHGEGAEERVVVVELSSELPPGSQVR